MRFRDNDYRADRLYDISPFRVADIGFNAILQRANQDLRFLLAAAGDIAGAAEVATMEQKADAAIARSWHEEDGFFYGIDTHAVMIRKPGIAGAFAVVCGCSGGHAAFATGAAVGGMAGSGHLWRAELRTLAAGVRAPALLARSGVADRELDAGGRVTAKWAHRVGLPDPSTELNVGRAFGLCGIFQPADRRAARRFRVFMDRRHVSAFRRYPGMKSLRVWVKRVPRHLAG
jgi:hypothetical protein